MARRSKIESFNHSDDVCPLPVVTSPNLKSIGVGGAFARHFSNSVSQNFCRLPVDTKNQNTMTTLLSSATTGRFHVLCDNTLALLTSFLDFLSAVKFSKTTSKSLALRFFLLKNDDDEGPLNHVWKEMYKRHLFTPSPYILSYIQECEYRRILFSNLLCKKKGRKQAFFNLPNRYFHFVPITPQDHVFEDDPPPVQFDCDSFLLTTGCEGEMLFLNPLDMSLSVQASCTDNAVTSDEVMMTQGSNLNENNTVRTDPPKQVLLDANDYFQINLAEYFELTEGPSRRLEDGRLLLNQDDEVDFGYLGIDCKPNDKGGTMIALGRFLSSLSIDNDVSCVEIITWQRLLGEEQYGHQYYCRIPWDIQCVEVCAMYNRIYVSYLAGQGPVDQKTVVAYPLVPKQDDLATQPRYFSKPDFFITCNAPVADLSIDLMGMVLVGTCIGTIELWEPTTGRRLGILDVSASTIASARRFRAERAKLVDTSSPRESTAIAEASADEGGVEQSQGMTGNQGSEQEGEVDAADADEDQEEWLPRFHGSPSIDSLYLSKHLSMEECGFVSMQHSRAEGTTLQLWKPTESFDFQVVSQIHLPLSPRRKPCIYYDGRRLIVCGQDHIGLIILVYHVRTSREDLHYFSSRSGQHERGGDESGGVQNFTFTPHVYFANRIRHAALGGLDAFDSMHMTCNERYLIVNTKTGNLLGPSPMAEGLLVIDLQDE